MPTVLTALVTALLAAEGGATSTTTLLVRRTTVAPAPASALTREAAGLLEKGGLPMTVSPEVAVRGLAKAGVVDSATCNGKKACVAELGRQVGVAWVVAVSISQVEGDRSLALELVQVSDATVAARDSVLLVPGATLTAEALAAFAQRAAQVVGVAPPRESAPGSVAPVTPPGPADAPVVTPLTPTEAPVAVVVAAPAVAHTGSLVLGSVGGAVLVASVASLVLGLTGRAALSAGPRDAQGQVHSTLSGGDAQALSDRANLQLGLAGAGAAVAAGLGAAAFFTW